MFGNHGIFAPAEVSVRMMMFTIEMLMLMSKSRCWQNSADADSERSQVEPMGPMMSKKEQCPLSRCLQSREARIRKKNLAR